MEMTETKLEENRNQDLGVEVQDDAIWLEKWKNSDRSSIV